MKRSRIQIMATGYKQFAGPIDTEQLESRRLFAGVAATTAVSFAESPAVLSVAFAPHGSEAAYVMHRALPRAAMAWQSTVFGGPMLVVTETGRVTAASSVTTAAMMAAPSTSAAGSTALTTAALSASVDSNASISAPVQAPTGTAAASLMHTATPAGAAGNDPAALVRAADTDVSPVAAAIARSTDAAIAAGTAGRVFGPFVIASPSAAAPTTAATATPSGLANLLALTGRAQSTAQRWAEPAQSASRSHRATADVVAEEAEGDLPVIVVAGQTAEQATLAAFVGDNAVRPLWQRVSIATAGVALVAANWIVRRRNRKLAAAGVMRDA